MESVKFKFVDPLASSGDLEAQKLLTPKRGSAKSAGLDLVSSNPENILLKSKSTVMVKTGIALELPEGFEGQVRPRSGLALKHGITVLNSPGTIDEDYRGEVCVILINHSEFDFVIERGMRIAQLVLAKVSYAELEEAKISETKRGEQGFGSSGI